MKIKYSNDVKTTIRQYAQSLKTYPISKERRNKKIKMLRNYLQNTIRSICETIGIASYPLCTFIDLGQTFNKDNQPNNNSLRQTHFADESGTQWMISFMVLEDNHTILIKGLRQSQNTIKESIVIKESQLRKIIRESINKIYKYHLIANAN